ncbi:MAG: mechanosensitive ion channel [Chitinophagaceae bacterium]
MKFLDLVVLDNSIRSYIAVAGSILLALFLKRFLSRYIAGLLFMVVKRIVKGVDKKSFVELVISPLETFLLLLVILISFDKLDFPKVLDVSIYKITTHQFIDGVSIIILIITFIWLLLRIMDFVAMILHQKAELTENNTDNQLVVFFKDFFKVVLVIFGFLLILKFAFHYRISNLLTGLSIATAAIALSTRESLENLIASFIIFFDKPFTTGDLVKVHAYTGTVEKIGLRSTRIRTDQKTFVTVPNKQMVDSLLDNLSLRTQRRAFVQLEISAATSEEQLQDFLRSVEQLLNKRKDKVEVYTVLLADIVKDTFVITIEFFTAPVPVADFNATRQDINLAIISLMKAKNIRLATKDAEITIVKE